MANDPNLTSIKELLPKRMARDAWVADSELRAKNVHLTRRYFEGDFDANMTREMREALRVKKGREAGANHCARVINAMADRLNITSIISDNKAANDWLLEILEWNEFDGFQMDIHEDALVSADSYVFIDWDNDNEIVRWVHEPAYDGREGMLVIPSRTDRAELACAIKIWYESRESFADTLRVNFYYADRIERYWNGRNGKMEFYKEDGFEGVLPWLQKDNKTPIGVPVVHFANRRRGMSGFGVSEIQNVITLQDGHNRALHSMLMNTEYTGFSVKFAKGFKPDAKIQPGAIISVYPMNDDGEPRAPQDEYEAAHLNAIDLKQLPAGDISPMLAVYEKLENQIGTTTSTPDIGTVSADASGEARKQSEVGLLGKIKRFQKKAGNSWSIVAKISADVYNAFSANVAPDTKKWTCQWQSAEVRSEAQVIETAMSLVPLIGKRAAIREVAKAMNWDEEYIDRIMEELAGEQNSLAQTIIRNTPMFNGQAPESRQVTDGRDRQPAIRPTA